MQRHTLCFMVGAVLMSSLAGCTTIGEKSFACPGRPTGVRCMSASEVYEATQLSDVVAANEHGSADGARSTTHTRERQHGVHDGSPSAGTKSAVPTERIQSTVPNLAVLPEVDKPMPIRTPARVMRAWVAPWEDNHGRAHAGGNVFIEIETRRWLFGEPTTNEPVRIFSIQTQMNRQEPVGKDPRASQVRAGTSERVTRPSSTLPTQGAPNESSHAKADTPPR